jgi:phosphopantetheinyl transferase
MWTAKEAVLKATGQGIASRLRDVDVAPAGWTVQSLNVGAGYVASLAVDASPVSVSFEEWRN